jgi:hypothetical protein
MHTNRAGNRTLKWLLADKAKMASWNNILIFEKFHGLMPELEFKPRYHYFVIFRSKERNTTCIFAFASLTKLTQLYRLSRIAGHDNHACYCTFLSLQRFLSWMDYTHTPCSWIHLLGYLTRFPMWRVRKQTHTGSLDCLYLNMFPLLQYYLDKKAIHHIFHEFHYYLFKDTSLAS